MSIRRARLVAGAAIAIIVASAATAVSLDPTTPRILFVPITAFVTVGATIVSLRPRNPIGWLFLTTAVLWATGSFASDYAVQVYSSGRESGWATGAAWYAEWYWIPAVTLVGVFNTFLFPTGRLPSRRWRPLFALAVLASGAFTVLAALDPSLEPADEIRLSSPVGVSSLGDIEEGVLGGILALSIAGFAVAAVASLLLRFRRSRGEERQQLKWFAYAGTLLVFGWFALIVAQEIRGDTTDGGLALLMSLPPLAAGIAILRYRLYDIDVVINRTLVYGALTALLAGTYFGLVLLLQLVFEPLTQGSDLAIAGSTLAVAALFRPARRRIQEVVDRRFYRRKYDATQTLEAFSARLREEVDLHSLAAELSAVAGATVQPAHVSLWVREAAR